MKFKRILPILLALCLFVPLLSAPAFAAVDPPHLQSADAALVVDMNTDTILYELNKDQFHSIASLTKIMTCLLAVEAVERGQVNLDDQVTAQADVLQGLDVSSSNANIQPGETFTFEDLIYCALVHSANDACNAIATHVAGSIGAFVNMMNDRADSLGCISTHYNDTCGMLNRTEGHFSCPYDLYLITREAMSHPLFARVCGTADYHVHGTNYRPDGFDIHNSNALMSTDGLYGNGYIYDGVVGVKTGFTKPAGYCLVSVCQRKDSRIMAIVLGCNGPLTYTFAGDYQNFQDSVTLYEWAFSNFTNKTIFLAGEPMQRFPVENAKNKGTVALCASETLVLLVPNDIQQKEIVTEIIPDTGALVAPVKGGTEIGTINVYVRGEKYASVRLTADADVELDAKIIRNQKIHDFFTSSTLKTVLIALVVLFVLLVALRIFSRFYRRAQVERRVWEREQQRDAERRTPIRVDRRPEDARPVREHSGTQVHTVQRPAQQTHADAGSRSVSYHQQSSPHPVQPHAGGLARPQQNPSAGRTPVQAVPRQGTAPRPAESTGHAFPSSPSAQSKGTKIQRIQRPASESHGVRPGDRDISTLIGRDSATPTHSEEDLDELLASFRREYGDK